MPEIFPNAPIIEALVDFKVKFTDPIDMDRLKEFANTLGDRFSERTTKKQLSAGIHLGEEGPPEVDVKSSEQGFVLKTKENDCAIQVQRDGFTFSTLKPYKQWESTRDEAKEYWIRYKEFLGPSTIKRLALRYINRIDIPLPLSDFREYVRTCPEVAPGIPQAVTNFFFKVVVPDPETGAWSNIISTMTPQDDENILPLILDIDVFFQKEYDIDSEEIWKDLEKLREFKNKIFFSSITEKARELFR